MAIKRADLRKIFSDTDAVSDDQITSVLNLIHGETDKLRDSIDDLNTQLDAQKKSNGDNDNKWKTKYDQEHEAFEAFKTEVQAEKTKETKTNALRELLKDSGLSEKGLEKALKYADYNSIELNEDGVIKEAGNLTKAITEEWSDYVTDPKTKGQDVDNPPGGKGSTFAEMSLAEKMTYANNNPSDADVVAWLKG